MNPTSHNSSRFICVFTEKIEKYETRNIKKLWTNVLKHIQKGSKMLVYWKTYIRISYISLWKRMQAKDYLYLLDSEKPKLYFSRRRVWEEIISWAVIRWWSWKKKNKKMTKFKADFRLVKVNNSNQVIPIYKAKTFSSKNMYNTLCKILTKYS